MGQMRSIMFRNMHKKWKDPVNSEIETTKYNTEPFSISVLLNMDQIRSHRGVYFICAAFDASVVSK